MLRVVTKEDLLSKEKITLTLDEIARQGAQRMLAEALQLEVSEYVEKHKEETDKHGRRKVVRNGKAKTRKVTVGSGTFEVSAPRVNDRRDGKHYCSSILPAYLRKSPKVEALLPLLYLRGLSTNDFKPALEGLLGKDAGGLSSSSISVLKKSWQKDFDAWNKLLIHTKYAYIWADGVNVKIRLGEDKKLCLLVVIGVTESGKKELIAVEPGYRESTEAWSVLLRSLKQRGMSAPLLAIGDGALGFWKAIRSVYPETKEQRCWVHKIANVLNKLPKRIQPKAKQLLHEMMYAETEADALALRKNFESHFELKHEKAVVCLQKHWEELMTFYSFPAANWTSIRTTNPIESSFATVKLRTKVTKGAGNATTACTMAFKLLQQCEMKWRKVRGHKEIQNLLSGLEYKDGIMIPEQDQRVLGC